MKKLIVLTLTLVLTVSVFSSCSSGTEETTLTPDETTAVSAENTPEIHSASAGAEDGSSDTTEATGEADAASTEESVFYVG